MVTAQQFAAAAAALEGARFLHRGRSRDRIDCIGLPFVAAAACSLAVRPFIDYRETPDESVLLAAVAERCEQRDWREHELAGRVLVLRQTDDGPPRHFAVSLGERWTIQMNARRARRVLLPDLCPLVHSAWLVRGVSP